MKRCAAWLVAPALLLAGCGGGNGAGPLQPSGLICRTFATQQALTRRPGFQAYHPSRPPARRAAPSSERNAPLREHDHDWILHVDEQRRYGLLVGRRFRRRGDPVGSGSGQPREHVGRQYFGAGTRGRMHRRAGSRDHRRLHVRWPATTDVHRGFHGRRDDVHGLGFAWPADEGNVESNHLRQPTLFHHLRRRGPHDRPDLRTRRHRDVPAVDVDVELRRHGSAQQDERDGDAHGPVRHHHDDFGWNERGPRDGAGL